MPPEDPRASTTDRPEAGDADSQTLAGRNAVVTGSSSGIGRAIALRLARGGARVLVHARRSRDAAESVRAAIVAEHGDDTPAVVLADLATTDGRDALLDAAQRAFGDAIDVWVNNAGADVLTGDAARASFEDKLDRLWEVDVRATILLSRAVGARMKARGRGVILEMGWDQAATGMEADSGEMFATTKGAVMAFTRSLARSLAPEVRVNCLAPGWVRTAWGETAADDWQQRVLRETPLERWGCPEDIAEVAAFLASDAASFVTGQIVNVNGGAVR